MKRLALIALLLAASTGCRGGIIDRWWHGDIYRGDACGSCGYRLPADPGCSSCGTAAGYGTYETPLEAYPTIETTPPSMGPIGGGTGTGT
ncbi:MAG: hypothetical protein VXZ82_00550 [Planctomycetota bacterium]|nr:hypothetical protein [Planctomycetota bacterium]